MKHWLTLLMFAVLCTAGAQSQQAKAIASPHWKASWITMPGSEPGGYGVYRFRRSILLSSKPSRYEVHISADNRYKLYVNGRQVALGPARSDPYHWYYETIDLAPYLQNGNNTIAALVWNFGTYRPEAQMSLRTGFILQGKTDPASPLNTGPGWMVMRDSAYRPLSPELIYTYYVAGPGEQVNYDHYPQNWELPGYTDKHWKPAANISIGLPKGGFDWSNDWMLVPSPLPAMEMEPQLFAAAREISGTVLPEGFLLGSAPLTIAPGSRVSILLDQGYLTNAYPVVQFSGGNQARCSLTYAESLYIVEPGEADWRKQSQKGHRDSVAGKRMVGVRDEWTSAGRPNQEFIPLHWRTFRYVKLEIETAGEALQVNRLASVATGYPFTFKARFQSGNPLHEKILETGWRTAKACAVETYMDCPYYEQLQYFGDTRIQALVSLFNSGDDRLVRNAIAQADRSRMSEGITLSRYPTAHAQQIPTFSLWWIGMLHDYWMYGNDQAFVQQHFPGMRQVLSFFSNYQQPDGRVRNAPYWLFTDWTEAPGWDRGMAPIGKDGCSAAVDLQLLLTYQEAAEMETRAGNAELGKEFGAKASRLTEAVMKHYWRADKNLFTDNTDNNRFSQHVNALAILAGLLPATDRSLLARKLITDTSLAQATIYFQYYVNRALHVSGLGDRYLDRLQIWEENLRMGLTTWAEKSDVNRSRSDCHAWGASPNIEFFRILLGIDSDAPGFTRVKIMPNPGSLRKLSGKMPHPRGEITVDYHYDEQGKMTAIITLPPGTPGNFVWKGKTYPLRSGRNHYTVPE